MHDFFKTKSTVELIDLYLKKLLTYNFNIDQTILILSSEGLLQLIKEKIDFDIEYSSGKIPNPYSLTVEPTCTGLPDYLATDDLFMKILKQNNIELVHVFMKYKLLPKLKDKDINLSAEIVELYDKHHVKTKVSSEFLEQINRDKASITPAIISMQRLYRWHQRKKTETERIELRRKQFELNPQFHSFACDEHHLHPILKKTVLSYTPINALLSKTRLPYIPHCFGDKELSRRLITIVSGIKLRTEASHQTAAINLVSILDSSICGKRTLVKRGVIVNHGISVSNDMKNGDADVICFGLDNIDNGCPAEAKIVIDLDKLKKDPYELRNPGIFFKPKDLGIEHTKLRHIKIGELELFFDHTDLKHPRRKKIYDTQRLNAIVINGFSVYLPNDECMFYNFRQMDATIIMHFFRYLEKGIGCHSQITKNIYDALSKLNDDELRTCLTELGLKFSDCGEINFMGAFQIPLSIVNKIIINDYEINLPEIMEQLKTADHRTTLDIILKIYQLIPSERLKEFMMNGVTDEVKSSVSEYMSGLATLNSRHESCKV